jgi:hypothetical protein
VDCAIILAVESREHNAITQIEETRIMDLLVVINSVLLTLMGLAKRDWPKLSAQIPETVVSPFEQPGRNKNQGIIEWAEERKSIPKLLAAYAECADPKLHVALKVTPNFDSGIKKK